MEGREHLWSSIGGDGGGFGLCRGVYWPDTNREVEVCIGGISLDYSRRFQVSDQGWLVRQCRSVY